MESQLLQKLKYAEKLTTQEKHIVDFILNNPHIVFHSTAHELAQLTYTSSSTIVRLCKKLGTRGYPDFQLKLALEHQPSSPPFRSEDQLIAEQGNVLAAIESVPYLYEQSLSETRRLLNPTVLQRIIDWVRKSHRIDIYGNDMNYYLAQQACTKWNELGISAIAHNSPNLHYLNTMTPSQTTLSFVISHTGENLSMIDAATILSQKSMKVIAVTSNNHSTLSRQCTETLLTHGYYEQLRLSKMSTMVSVLYLFDILYMGSISDSY